jgi:hypothetical protein
MRYLGAIALVFTGLLSLLIFAGPNARAASSPSPSPAAPVANQIAATATTLTQQSPDTWTTTVFVDTGALCPVPVFFNLETTKPYSDTLSGTPQYVNGLDCSPAGEQHNPVTEVMLTFTPSPQELTAVPQTASLALTPPAGQLALSVVPMTIPLTVRRQVSTRQYLWYPLVSGVALAVLLVLFTGMLGVPRQAGRVRMYHGGRFWRMPLHASAAWSFGDSWATNITAVSTVIGAVFTASGSVAELIPGVELGRFGLLLALAGVITAGAPLLFGWLNYQFGSADQTIAASAVVSLSKEANTVGARIALPASGTVTAFGPVKLASGEELNPGVSLDIPVGAVLTVASPASIEDGASQQILVLPGTSDIVVTPGQRLSVNAGLAIPESDITKPGGESAAEAPPALPPVPPAARPTFLNWLEHLLPKAEGTSVGSPKTIVLRPFDKGTAFEMTEGAKISFLGRATLTLPAGAAVAASPADPDHPPRDFVLPRERDFAIPRTGEVVTAQMWTMLTASCLTVFGIGAEIGIVGWVLGFNLAVAPVWARSTIVVLAAAAVMVVLGYGVAAIRALAEPREGTVLSGPRDSSFML